MLQGQNQADLAIALLQFKAAWKNLCVASKKNEDYDFSEMYPFFLLDFEVIEPAVASWCITHASKLMQSLPDQVDNPACTKCRYFRKGWAPGGLCIGADATQCNSYPRIIFSVDSVRSFMMARGVDISKLSADEIHLLYIKECNNYENELAKERGQAALDSAPREPGG